MQVDDATRKWQICKFMANFWVPWLWSQYSAQFQVKFSTTKSILWRKILPNCIIYKNNFKLHLYWPIVGVDQCLFRCEIETGHSMTNYALIRHIGMEPETLNIAVNKNYWLNQTSDFLLHNEVQSIYQYVFWRGIEVAYSTPNYTLIDSAVNFGNWEYNSQNSHIPSQICGFVCSTGHCFVWLLWSTGRKGCFY